MIALLAKRVVLAVGALTGKLDHVQDIASVLKRYGESIEENDALVGRLRRTVERVHAERQYWYDTWFAQGKEFEAAMTHLCEEIDSRGQKLHIKEKYFDGELLKKAFHQRHVQPPSHPIPNSHTELKQVDAPPVPPSESPDASK